MEEQPEFKKISHNEWLGSSSDSENESKPASKKKQNLLFSTSKKLKKSNGDYSVQSIPESKKAKNSLKTQDHQAKEQNQDSDDDHNNEKVDENEKEGITTTTTQSSGDAISEVDYKQALKIRKKYLADSKRLSLKQKTLYKKAKSLISAYEKKHRIGDFKPGSDEDQSDEDSDVARFEEDRSIFDTKKGQVLFELQKQYKGDSRFKLDSRFAEDIEVDKLPLSVKQLTTGIDFQNLSDGSDHEQKKLSKKQKKDKKEKEKGLSSKKKQKKNKVLDKNSDLESADDDVKSEESEQFTKWISSDDDGIDEGFASELAEDYINQEELLEGEEKTFEEEVNAQLHVLQEIMPDQKLFLQNKKKNLKIVNNQFAGYGAMMSAQEALAVAAAKAKKKNLSKKQKLKKLAAAAEDEDGMNSAGDNSGQEEQDQDASKQKQKLKKGGDNDNGSGDSSSDEDARKKKEKSYNLVIPRFDPSQLIVKQVMKTQEKEREDKLKEKELSQKKQKKLEVEAKIEAGIDKKLQKIMQANQILDKNLTEHKKLEGVVEVKKKKPMLKKIAIDANKWKDIIQSAMASNPETVVEGGSEVPAAAVEAQKKSVATVVNEKPAAPVKFQRNLSLLFATVPVTANIDPSRAQFKLFG